MRDARAEAQQHVPDGYEARVLEPAPPPVTEPPWFADDPVARDGAERIVGPTSAADETWEAIAADDEAVAAFARERWLGPYRRLEPLPDDYAATRAALHAVAEGRMKPARAAAEGGKFGLRYTLGGFGTPFFAPNEQLRVQDGELIEVRNGHESRERLDGVHVHPAKAIGDWFGFGASVTEELRARHGGEDPKRVQLWPEHFDLAWELGELVTFGFSPGDDEHPEPYVYVLPWGEVEPGPLWNATGFTGAELSYAALLDAADQRGEALAFCEAHLDSLR